MKLNTTFFSFAFGTLVISVGTFTQQSLAQTQRDRLKVVEAENLDGENVQTDSQTFEIRIDNGDVTVKRNGKAVPKEQIKQEGGRVIIIDENGNQLKDLNVMLQPFHFNLGSGDFDKLKWFGGEQGPPPKVMLGIHMSEPTEALEYHLGLEPDTSAMISGLYEGLPAREAGLGQFDVIIKVDGKSPATAQMIKETLASKESGDTVTFTVIQKGTQRDVKVKLQPYDAEKMSSAKLIGEEPMPQIWSMLGNQGWGDQGWGEFKEIPKLEFPQLKDRELFVVPDVKGQKRELIAPLPELRRFYQLDEEREGVEKQLEQLDKRMADLEKMLEKLVEREQRTR